MLFGTLKGTFYAMLFAVPLGAVRRDLHEPLHDAGVQEDGQAGRRDHGGDSVGGDRVPGGAVAGADPGDGGSSRCSCALVTIPAAFLAFMVVWQLVRRFDVAKRVENGYEFLAWCR